MPRPNGTATSIATLPITTLPTKIVRRSKRDRRGNQPVSLSNPKSQSIALRKLIVPLSRANRMSRLITIDVMAAAWKTTRIMRSRRRRRRLPCRSWIVSMVGGIVSQRRNERRGRPPRGEQDGRPRA